MNMTQGKLFFKKKMTINKDDNAALIEKKVHNLEYKYYPKIIASLLHS